MRWIPPMNRFELAACDLDGAGVGCPSSETVSTAVCVGDSPRAFEARQAVAMRAQKMRTMTGIFFTPSWSHGPPDPTQG